MKGHLPRSNTAAYIADPAVRVGTCTYCGKVIFLCRKAARVAARSLTGGGRPRAYRCLVNADHWHVGHIPAAVRQGTIGREQWRRDAKGARA